jgi:hypothetical protein
LLRPLTDAISVASRCITDLVGADRRIAYSGAMQGAAAGPTMGRARLLFRVICTEVVHNGGPPPALDARVWVQERDPLNGVNRGLSGLRAWTSRSSIRTGLSQTILHRRLKLIDLERL